jgi:APA family basic amino acid/polyamine antiporter
VSAAARPQQLGFWMCVALVVGNTIGSGVFLLPTALAPLGVNSLYGWLITTAGALGLVVLFTQLSRAHPDAGGPYAYTRLAFGPFAAFIVAWGYWISIWVGNAAIATGMVSYLSPFLPRLSGEPALAAGVTLAVLWGLTLVNWFGIKASGWVTSVTTVLKLLPLFAIAAVGLASVRAPDVAAFVGKPLTAGSTTSALTLVLWAVLGIESATIPADKVREPRTTIPRATLAGGVLTAIICFLACTTVLLKVPMDVLAHSDAPFADLAQRLWGAGAGKLMALFVAISAFGCLNGWVMLQAELPQVMAKSGVFPRIFARESARRTPTFALLFTSGLVTVLILMNYQKSMSKIFEFMILLSLTACLVMYALCSLALLRLTATGRMQGASLRTGVLGGLGVFAALYSVWAIIGAGSEAVGWGFVLLALGVPVYLLVRLFAARE